MGYEWELDDAKADAVHWQRIAQNEAMDCRDPDHDSTMCKYCLGLDEEE